MGLAQLGFVCLFRKLRPGETFTRLWLVRVRANGRAQQGGGPEFINGTVGVVRDDGAWLGSRSGLLYLVVSDSAVNNPRKIAVNGGDKFQQIPEQRWPSAGRPLSFLPIAHIHFPFQLQLALVPLASHYELCFLAENDNNLWKHTKDLGPQTCCTPSYTDFLARSNPDKSQRLLRLRHNSYAVKMNVICTQSVFLVHETQVRWRWSFYLIDDDGESTNLGACEVYSHVGKKPDLILTEKQCWAVLMFFFFFLEGRALKGAF